MPCLRVIELWADTWKEWGSHLKTSAGDADPLRKRKLFSTFFASAYLSVGVDIGYLAQHFLCLTELSSIDIKDIASFIEFSGWFSSVM